MSPFNIVSSSRTFAPIAPLDDRLKGVASDVLQRLKYSFLLAASNPDAGFSAGSPEEEFRQALTNLKPELHPRLRSRTTEFLSRPVGARTGELGRYANLDLAEYRERGFDDAAGSTTIVIDSKTLASKLGQFHKPESDQTLAKPVIDFNLPKLDRARFMIAEVKCVDETNPEPFGDDEILMGGLAIGWKGNVKKVNPFLVDDEFDDGDVKKYPAPGKEFASFDLKGNGDWPRTFSTVVFIAEQDWISFASGLALSIEKLSKKIHDEIVKAGVSVLSEYFGEKFAQIIGQIATWIYNTLLQWILSWIGDDVFKPGYAIGGVHTPLALAYKDDGVPGGWKNYQSPLGQFSFVGHGGEYRVKCYWKLELAA